MKSLVESLGETPPFRIFKNEAADHALLLCTNAQLSTEQYNALMALYNALGAFQIPRHLAAKKTC